MLDGMSDVALKLLDPKAAGSDPAAAERQFLAEIDIMRASRHANIVSFIGGFPRMRCRIARALTLRTARMSTVLQSRHNKEVLGSRHVLPAVMCAVGHPQPLPPHRILLRLVDRCCLLCRSLDPEGVHVHGVGADEQWGLVQHDR